MDRRKALATIGLSSVAGTLFSRVAMADAEEEVVDDSGEEIVQLLFVQESEGFRSDGTSMTLVGVNPRTLWFANRPQKMATWFFRRLTLSRASCLLKAGLAHSSSM